MSGLLMNITATMRIRLTPDASGVGGRSVPIGVVPQ